MEKVFTSREYAAWLRRQAEMQRPYWYGTYYLDCTEKLLKKKSKQYPEHYGESRMARYLRDIANGQICGDCVNGAIKGAVWSELGTRPPVYKSHDCPDTNADGMFRNCKAMGMDWGGVDTLPDEPGLAVRMAGHVGIYVGDGEVVEWRGFKYGCVVTRLEDRRWLHWYRLPWVDYGQKDAGAEDVPPAGEDEDFSEDADLSEETDAPDGFGGADDADSVSSDGVSTLLGTRLLRRGAKDEDVRTLQKELIALGYKLPKWGADGEYGRETEAAVKAFQRFSGLTADGEYGPDTHDALICYLSGRDESDVSAPDAPVQYVLVTGGTVNLRCGPGLEYDIHTVVRRGARLVWIATAQNGWHAVRSDCLVGWLSPKYTELASA